MDELFSENEAFPEPHAIKGMINYVCALQAAGLVLYLIAPELLNTLY